MAVSGMGVLSTAGNPEATGRTGSRNSPEIGSATAKAHWPFARQDESRAGNSATKGDSHSFCAIPRIALRPRS
jgi:hypothetical protein